MVYQHQLLRPIIIQNYDKEHQYFNSNKPISEQETVDLVELTYFKPV
jgi:hypothetical protein